MSGFKKVGILFLAVVIALAAVGTAFASWTQDVTFRGDVQMGTLEFEPIELYSGTCAYKTENHGILVDSGWLPLPIRLPDPDTGFPMLIGCSYAQQGTEPYDIEFVYNNIFPCVNWCADFAVHYVGSVPVMVCFAWDASDLPPDVQVTIMVCWYNADTGEQGTENLMDGDFWQMHNCDWVVVKVCIYVPQNDDLQGGSFSFIGRIHATQWNACDVVA